MLPYGYTARKPLITGVALEALRRDPRRAISEDHVVCLVCGAVFRHLTNTHLVHHAMTSADYKQSFGYNGRRSLMAHAVRRTHADNAVPRGLAQMIRRRPIVEIRRFAHGAGRGSAPTRKGCSGARTAAVRDRSRRGTPAGGSSPAASEPSGSSGR
jgi:hypothetical protein